MTAPLLGSGLGRQAFTHRDNPRRIERFGNQAITMLVDVGDQLSPIATRLVETNRGLMFSCSNLELQEGAVGEPAPC